MLPKPTVPLVPVTVKATVVVALDWYGVIVILDICCAVTFPLIAMSTVAPLAVVAGTVVADGVGEGDGVGVGVGAAVGVGVGVAVGVGVGVGVCANVAEMVYAA